MGPPISGTVLVHTSYVKPQTPNFNCRNPMQTCLKPKPQAPKPQTLAPELRMIQTFGLSPFWGLGFRAWLTVKSMWGLGFRVSGFGFRLKSTWGVGFVSGFWVLTAGLSLFKPPPLPSVTQRIHVLACLTSYVFFPTALTLAWPHGPQSSV